MIVRRLLISEYPLLIAMALRLEKIQPPPPPYDSLGDWRADVDAGPPKDDRPRPRWFRRQVMESGPLPSGAMTSALNYYPEGGAGLGWHTDSGRPGWRVYVARPLGAYPGELLVPGAVYRDVRGLATAFYVSGRPRASWHAVRADGPRLSFGIRIVTRELREALGLEKPD